MDDPRFQRQDRASPARSHPLAHRESPRRPEAGAGRSGFRFVLPLFCAGLLIAGVGLVIKRQSAPKVTIRQVEQEIVEVVQENGFLGPFRLGAAAYDGKRHEFRGFYAETDRLIVSAARARITISASLDTVGFTLSDVMFLQLPEDENAEASAPVARDEYVLGPFPWKFDIVADGVELKPPMNTDER